MKKEISKLLQKTLIKERIKLSLQEIENYIEIPPSSDMGDFAFPCFFLASKLKKNPNEIAKELLENINTKKFEVKVIGAYLNFFIDKAILAKNLIKEVGSKKDNYGKNKIGKGKKVVVEFSSPNIAKPFGIGHLRSTIIGNSLANLAEFNGYKVIRLNYLGDWGTQFGKLIHAFKKWGNEKKLKKDPIKYLLDLYVKINKEEYEEESRLWFKKLEQGDQEALDFWKKFKDLSLKDFERIYKILGIKFDVFSGESMVTKEEINLVLIELTKKKLLKQSEGAQVVNLKKYGLGVALIQKTDGTTVYALRDIASAIARAKKYSFDQMIYEVGQEQKLHFKQVFKILTLMGYEWADKCVHADHGLYLGKDGKKFATRKGKTVFMDDIINEAKDKAKKEIKSRFPKLSEKELEKRGMKVALAAIFYVDLKNNRSKDMVFDIGRFVSFEGDTGPYIQYSYARASSILRKSKIKNKQLRKFQGNLESKEIELIKKLLQFKEVVSNAYKNLNPSSIAHYSYELAQVFNEFYHSCQVIGSENESFRLKLTKVFRQILKNSLYLLGIEVLERM